MTPSDSWGVLEYAWDPTSTCILYTRDNEPNKLFLIDIETKKTWWVKTFGLPISMLKWSAEGHILTFTAFVYPDCSINETRMIEEKKAKPQSSTALAYDHSPVYRWNSFFNV